MEKKELIIGLAILIIVGATVGSVAMNGNSDKKHIDKKTKIVLETDQDNKDSKDNENSEEQEEESNTEENNTSEEQKEENVATSSSEEKKETKKESKREEKEKSKQTEEKKSKKEEKKTFSTEASKPSSKPASKPAPSNKPSKPNKPEPSKPSHTHNWVASTKQVHHPAVGHNEKVLVKAAWTEKIPRYKDVAREICNGCGADVTENYIEHNRNHMLKGEKGGRHTEYKKVFSHYEEVYHAAQYTTKWVIDKAAWTETVVTGYHCSCGAKK